jgi:acetolactate synthase-1/2/3 large subunit
VTGGATDGAHALVRTLADCGIVICFANPGTSELHAVAALDAEPRVRPVLCLFEGVATGAADGYGRIAGKPAATLLHLGPGLANGLANLHNARRAGTPIVNVVGDHATTHRQSDPPLASDIAGLARTVSAWIGEAAGAATVAHDAARAVQAARAAPGGIATLIVPADVAWSDGAEPAVPLADVGAPAVDAADVEAIARKLCDGSRSALLLRGRALEETGLEAAGRIQARTGARLLCDTFAPRAELGAGRVPVERIPYFSEHIVSFLRHLQRIVLVGASAPVAMFAYPGRAGSCLPEGCEVEHLAHPHQDGVQALLDLAAAVDAPPGPAARHPLALPELPRGVLTAMSVGQAIANLTPDYAIYAEEAATSSLPLFVNLARARPHTHLPVTGGSLGSGLPLAVGAALAAPERKIVCVQGDGGGAYTLQALWTIARERLDVTTVVYANRSYAILNRELERCGIGAVGSARSLLDLSNPELRWADIARGFGVEAARVTTCEEMIAHYAAAMAQRAPRLIEAVI